MNYTENYHLPQWEEHDRVMRTDFNQMCSDIDEGLRNAAELPYAIGNYVGTGSTSLEIEVGFKPRVVMVFTKQVGSQPSPPSGRFVAASELVTSNERIKITENGFILAPHYSDMPFPASNMLKEQYTYIAFR